ncbi:MAG TPA: N-formylglutamate amidohydrolase [Stellaceae bacterium]|nr:N-formylglutamate amidohydrolase [Stellaceae bacterium]
MPETAPFLARGEQPAFEQSPGRAGARVLLVCDHAGKLVPRALNRLGLDDGDLSQHIGWDIGAGAVTRNLAQALELPAMLSFYSRLVIDCNRDPDDPTSIPLVSDGVAIPGNRDLAAAACQDRRRHLFEPYHAAIAAWIAVSLGSGVSPALIGVHSFTPSMNGQARPWHVGVLWDGDGRIALPLLAGLRGEAGLIVGDNQPYSARQPAGYTMRHHAANRGLPHVALEIRQDLIAEDAGAREWAERLARVLRPILEDDSIYRPWQK